MSILIIVICGLLSCTKVTTQGSLARKSIFNANDAILANCCIFALTALMFSMSLFKGIDVPVIGYAALFGAFSASFQIFYALALRSGPFSITCMLVNLGMVLPVSYSLLFLGERLTLVKGIGLALCLIALFLNTQRDNAKISLKWLIYAVLAFLSTGTLSTVQKVYAKSTHAGDLMQFLFWGYLTAFVITFAVSSVQKARKQEINFKPDRSNILAICVIVLCLGMFQLLNTYANSFVDAAVLNPSVSGLSTMFLTLSGRIVFKEKFTAKQLCAIGVGLAGILLISM